jgi:hypothetical protein
MPGYGSVFRKYTTRSVSEKPQPRWDAWATLLSICESEPSSRKPFAVTNAATCSISALPIP